MMNHEDKCCPLDVQRCRDIILDLIESVSGLCKAVRLKNDPLHPLARLMVGLLSLADVLRLDLRNSIMHKLELNRQKYPVALCLGKTIKYTNYSSTTGITKTEGQSLLHTFTSCSVGDTTVIAPMAMHIQEWWFQTVGIVAQFRDERNWSKFHTPRNVCLAITSEFGELAEVLQFHDDKETEISMTEYDRLMQEMADVAIYSIALSDALPPDEDGVAFATKMLQQIKQFLIIQDL